MQQYCKYCGTALPKDAIFCPHCGKRLNEAPLFTIDDNNETLQDKKKKKRSWSIPVILLLIAVAAAGMLIVYNNFSTHSNALIPKDTIADNDSTSYDFDEEGNNPIDDAEDSEAALRRRVQNIYSDALKRNPNANYTGRYCTASFYSLVREAEAADMRWIDFDYWTFSQDYDRPTIEQMKVVSYKEEEATVKIALRPYYKGGDIKIITLKMKYEDGVWLIDDFQCDGYSIKTIARRTVEEAQIRREIKEEYEDSIMD